MSLDLIRLEMNKTDFYPEENLIPDGKIHRFKRKPGENSKDAWYIIFQWNTRSGEIGFNACWADWHEDEIHKFCTAKTLNSEDKKYVETKIKESQKKAELDREADYAQCRSESQTHLITLESRITPYLQRKGITDLCGSLCEGNDTIIPVNNDKGETQGYQIIKPDGVKFFKLHTKKKGNYFTIPGSDETWLTEGFATGATVHMATGGTVIVCFDAGNVSEVRKQFPNAILAGDNDEAGLKCGTGLFPPTEGMDWNDYYLANGIEAVTQLLTAEPNQWIRPLGYRDDIYYYTSSSNRQIIPLTASGHTSNNFFTLQPKEYWDLNYPGKHGPDYSLATSHLMEMCRKQGIFNPKNIRGTGVWLDPNPVINLGQSVYPSTPRTKHTYIISSPVSAPIGQTDPDLLLNILSSINFKHANHSKLLAGWLLMAPFSGALPWRPHVWLTGSAGTGKSTIMENIISPILGDFKLYTKGNTTEAGIRQMLGHNALPIIFDEFEQMGGDETRIKAILDLCRQASSESSGEIMKGSSSGKSTQYNPRFCALVSSIRINLSNDADQSRFTVLDLDEPNRENYPNLIKLMDQLTPEYCQGLFSFTFKNFNKFQDLSKYHYKELSKTQSARFSQQHSILLAGYELISGEVIPLLTEKTEEDHLACLDHLTSSLVIIELHVAKQRTIQECIEFIILSKDHADWIYYKTSLERYGIQVINQSDEASVNIAGNHPLLKRLFAGTQWVNGYAKSLSRIEKASSTFFKLNSKTFRGVKLQVSSILSI